VWHGSKLPVFRAFRLSELWIRGCGPVPVESYFHCHGECLLRSFVHLFTTVVTCSSLWMESLTHLLSSLLDCLSRDDGFWYIPLKCYVLYHHPAIQKQYSILFYCYINDDIHLPYRKSISTVKNFKLIFLIPVHKFCGRFSSFSNLRVSQTILLTFWMPLGEEHIYIYTHTYIYIYISVCIFFWGGACVAWAGFPFILPFVVQVDPVLHRFLLLVLQMMFTKICPVNLFVPLI